MRATPLFLLMAALAACDFGGLGGGENKRTSLLSSAGGEVALADGSSLEFRITSGQFKKWDRARRGINKTVAARFGALLNPSAPSAQSIDRAVAYLESQPSARRAIENAGMSVRGFVVMTVALEQEMRLASGQPAVEPPQPAPYEFPTIDTTFIPPGEMYPVAPTPPVPVDSFIRPDTLPRYQPPPVPVYVPTPPDTTRPSPTIFRRDTAVRRDSVIRRDSAIRRDTIQRRDTVIVPPRPVIPDTLPEHIGVPRPSLPPDTLRKT